MKRSATAYVSVFKIIALSQVFPTSLSGERESARKTDIERERKKERRSNEIEKEMERESARKTDRERDKERERGKEVQKALKLFEREAERACDWCELVWLRVSVPALSPNSCYTSVSDHMEQKHMGVCALA